MSTLLSDLGVPYVGLFAIVGLSYLVNVAWSFASSFFNIFILSGKSVSLHEIVQIMAFC